MEMSKNFQGVSKVGDKNEDKRVKSVCYDPEEPSRLNATEQVITKYHKNVWIVDHCKIFFFWWGWGVAMEVRPSLGE